MNPLKLSIVIPIYNEERILEGAVTELREQLVRRGASFEILLAENGSRDRTVEIATELARRFDEVSSFSLGSPNYGAALREGILRARGEVIICEEIDLCDVAFHQQASAMIERSEADFVIGSKLLAGSLDERPFSRHAASLLYNGLLRTLVGYRGTDTHGLKAFRRELLLPVIRDCRLDRDVFASELVIRADRAHVIVKEIPVLIREKRPPSINLTKRVPAVLKLLAKLTWSIRASR
jgi:glycosyltransferase involved in cell wall biosynthesis